MTQEKITKVTENTKDSDVLDSTGLFFKKMIDNNNRFIIHISYIEEGKIVHYNGRYKFPSEDMLSGLSSFDKFITSEHDG